MEVLVAKSAAIDAAVAALRRGEVVALPTDTVYGLAADPHHARGLFAAKGRPRSVELPVLVADEGQALDLVEVPTAEARRLMARFWPGPLTLVLARRPGLGFDLGGSHETIGVRCPDHPVPRAICAAVGPIATTSANRHGEPPLTSAGAVAETLGETLGLILDGGLCVGAPSSVVELTGPAPRLLRQGAVGWSSILGVLD
jgi:tRNA threonylcarbamoyl adenosine modification protein (Sua5/YciO/YrdC/YwlC family)